MIGLIPAAGSGTRMYPFTRANPKELYHIDRMAVIDHAITSLHEEAGVNKVFIIIGGHKSAIIDHVGDGSRLNNGDLKVSYLYQEELKGLANAIYQGKEWVNEDFMVHVGDSFVYPKSELKKMVQVHEKEKPFATLVVKEIDSPEKHGVVRVDNNSYLIDAIEKPSIEEAEPFKTKSNKYLAIIAIYIFNKGIFNYIEKTPVGVKGEYQITDSIKLALKDGKKIRIIPIKGEYMDIGNWESAEEAQDFFRKIKKGQK
ncbi:MAG: NTP transferase domain-containing protein [Nanoarchaeota archaeon]|nr:NTP transferase domain-containing protein [Nanoarchaeota archaeon]